MVYMILGMLMICNKFTNCFDMCMTSVQCASYKRCGRNVVAPSVAVLSLSSWFYLWSRQAPKPTTLFGEFGGGFPTVWSHAAEAKERIDVAMLQRLAEVVATG